ALVLSLQLSTGESCRPGTRLEPTTVLDRALSAMGVSTAGDRVLHIKAAESNRAREQSDRWYPPFLQSVRNQEFWLDPRTGAVRYTSETVWPGNAGVQATRTLFGTGTATYGIRDT